MVYKSKVKASERTLIKSSKDCYKTLLKVWDENKMEMQEEFKLLLINRANRVTGVYEASADWITGTVGDLRLILAATIKGLAVGIVLTHNHPSDNLKPSLTDEQFTAKLKTAASDHDIRVLSITLFLLMLTIHLQIRGFYSLFFLLHKVQKTLIFHQYKDYI